MTQDEIDAQLIREFPLMFFEMLEPQSKFIRCRNAKGRTPRRRIFEAGNKCIAANTQVETPTGNIPVGVLYRIGKPFEVYAWDGNKKVVAQATAPFKKFDRHACYRISFPDGTFLDAADYHRVLTDKGWLFVQHLYESAFDPLESKTECSLSVLPSGVVHLSETQSDFLESCYGDFRQCDGQPLFWKDNAQVSSPSPDDAERHSDQRPCLDVQDCIRKYSLYVKSFRPSILDVLRHYAVRFVEYLGLNADRLFPPLRYELRLVLQPSIAGEWLLQSDGESVQYQYLSNNASSSSEPPLYGNNKVCITPIPGLQEVYDFTVEKYHNYYAGGLINHNCGKTEIGIAEDIAHLMGFRPWLEEDDPDYRIDIKIPCVGLIAGETMVHSIGEKIEPTLRRLIPKTCQPVFKAGPTGVAIKVTLTNDWKGRKCGSVAYLRSYDQRPDTFEGIDFAFAHFDEPPPEKIINAIERGKVVTNAPSWYTMTPLKEPYFFDRFSSKAGIRI